MVLIGELNADSKFLEMLTKLQRVWYTLAKERELKNVALKIIVDDVFLCV